MSDGGQIDVDERGPHADEHAAPIAETDEAAYTLVGALIEVVGDDGELSYHVLVGEGLTRPVDAEVLPLFEFFAAPKTESQAREWLAWADAPDDLLDTMVEEDILVRIDTTSTLTAAASLAGLRLAPQSVPIEDDHALEGFVAVARQDGGPVATYITIELAAVLWGDNGSADVPTVIASMTEAAAADDVMMARRVVVAIPQLLEQELARLEWVRVPA